MTVGGRVVVAADYEKIGIRWAASSTHSTHDQVESTFDATGTIESSTTEMRFQQMLYSTGLEADYTSGLTTYSAGFNVDARSVPDADVFDAPSAQVDIGARAGVIHDLSQALDIRASIGRRSRFPTLREQFSGALGRFVLNPDLGSEEAILAESSIGYHANGVRLGATAFVTATDNAIDQVVVIQDGVSRRMRVNLDGSRNLGLELSTSLRPVNRLEVAADLTVSRLRAKNSTTGEYDQKLTERPEHSAAVRTNYRHTSGLTGSVELAYTGTAYSLDEEGDLVELDDSTVLNIRGAYRLILDRSAGLHGEVVARVDNVADSVVENQLGLPGPGRIAKLGFKLAI